MSRTQRAIIRSQREAGESYNRQKNKDVLQLRALKEQQKGLKGEERRQKEKDIAHMVACVKKDRRLEKDFRDDVKIYRKRFKTSKGVTAV